MPAIYTFYMSLYTISCLAGMVVNKIPFLFEGQKVQQQFVRFL